MYEDQHINIRGLVTITKRNANTLEIISEETVENKVLTGFMRKLLADQVLDLNITISTTQYADIKSLGYVDIANFDLTYPSSILSNLAYVDGNPGYYQLASRFNQPTTTKTIHNIMMAEVNNNVVTKVILDPPCIQLNNEVLDITYRLQIPDIISPNVSKIYQKGVLNRIIFSSNNSVFDGHAYPYYAYANWHKPPTVQYNTIRARCDYKLPISQPLPQNRDDLRLRRANYNIPMTQTDFVGKIFGSVIFGSNFNDDLSDTNMLSMSHILPAAAEGFTNTPVQPIHNHSVTANVPFLDVNNLASGTGTVSINGDNWTNPDYPKYTLIEINNDGNIGTARYSFRQRNFTGFSGNSYFSDPHTAIGFRYDKHTIGGLPSILGGHGLKHENDRNQSTWDGRTIISSDSTGITLIDIINGNYVIFDSTTVPSLPVTDIRQISVDDNKNIWIADFASGLYKITDPYGTPSVTKILSGVNGDLTCMGVTIGANNSIWAIFDGGIGYSLDSGTTWTIFNELSGHPFLHTGLTDNNWTLARKIVVDKSSPDYQLAVIYTTGTTEQLVWWSLTDLISVGSVGRISARLTCSVSGGLWIWDTFNASNDFNKVRRLTYGTNIASFFGSNDTYDFDNRGLNLTVYDYYGSPYQFAETAPTFNNSSNSVLCNADRKSISEMRNFGSSSLNQTRQMTLNMEDSNSLGKGLYVNRNNVNDDTCQALTNICPGTNPGPYNLRYSVFEETVWDRYQWDGTNWILDYHAPALDTSGNNNNAIRHNFGVEDHMFTGRSMIDISPSFSTNTFNTIGTFVFTLTPSPKLSAARTTYSQQEQTATIFEFNDEAGNRLKLTWDNGSSNITISDELSSQIVVSTPANNISYRIAVVINNVDVKVYIDGLLVSTLAITSPIDLSNPNSNIRSYIGARTHAYEYNKKYNVGDFYRGTMNNIQLWNVEWNQTDITNDMVDITSVIVSKPNINLISRYELIDSLFGLETKATHISNDLMLDGVTINFTDGTTGPSFITDEHYTVALVDGFLKDNAMSIDYNTQLHMGSTLEPNYTTITNTVGTNIVPGLAATATEKLFFYGYNNDYIFSKPGEITSNYSGAVGGKSLQSSAGDMSIEFSPNQNNMVDTALIGFMFPNELGFYPNNFKHHLSFRNNGFVSALDGNITQLTDAISYTLTDVFKIERIGTTVKFYKNGTIFYTSVTPSTGTILCAFGCFKYAHGFHNMIVTYERQANLMVIGDEALQTGSYDPAFIGISTVSELFANGVLLDILWSSTNYASMLDPAPGTVYINGFNGSIKFNPAEIGTTITGKIKLIKDT